ncbi:unnamed protein product [Rotaria sp. Silwood1]|nr:unnamed protein product [Rotaria sp. Silwood1]
MMKIFLCILFLSLISAEINSDKFKILITVRESKSFINDIDGLSSNHTLIYLLYTYTEPYQLVKLNTSTLHPLAHAILPFHYNDTTFRQDFFLLTFSNDELFVGHVEDLGRPDAATWLQAIDLRSMTINDNLKQGFPFKQFTGFPLFQAISNRQKIIINLCQWDLTTKNITKPKIINGQLPSTDPYNSWLLPSISSLDETPQLLLMYDKNILYTLNVSSSSQWIINTQLSNIRLDFLSKSLSFHMDVVNASTISVADDQMNVFIYNLYERQLSTTLNLRKMFPDYPRMSEQIANNLRANDQYVYITSSTNVEPFDQQYLFRICLNDTIKGVDLLPFADENYGLTELVTFADTVYSFERLYEAEDYFNIYKIGTPHKNIY